MNKRLQDSIRMIGLGLLLNTPLLSLAATPSASTCASMLSLPQPISYKNCQANASTIQQCIQNNMASQTPNSSQSIATQLQASSNASQILAQLDFQCQYLLAYGSQPSFSSEGNSNSGFGSSLKKILGLPAQSSSSASNSSSSGKMAATNQAQQLDTIQPKPVKPAKNDSQDQNNNSNNSINWF